MEIYVLIGYANRSTI